jgi:hypothetical protein
MSVHILKTWPEFFNDAILGIKSFELRKNDRDYQVGDELSLREFIPEIPSTSDRSRGYFTGHVCRFRVIYVLKDFEFGLEPGYCILGITIVPNSLSI